MKDETFFMEKSDCQACPFISFLFGLDLLIPQVFKYRLISFYKALGFNFRWYIVKFPSQPHELMLVNEINETSTKREIK